MTTRHLIDSSAGGHTIAVVAGGIGAADGSDMASSQGTGTGGQGGYYGPGDYGTGGGGGSSVSLWVGKLTIVVLL